MKTILFCRVSSKEQEDTGYSLPAQEKLLKDYAVKHVFQSAKVFSISESASGKKQREIFLEMIKYAEKQKVKIIICEKVDRLTRNLKDAVSVNDWINKDPERQVHFVKENVVLNRDSKSNEKFIWNIKVSVAQYYIDNLSEEVKKGQKEKIAQGWLPTKPPLGYKTIGEKGHKIHVIDDKKAPLIRKMFEVYSTGNFSIKKLTQIMTDEGLRNTNGNKISKSRIHEYLRDVFYIGKNRWNGQVSQGKHEPLIKTDLFDKVQNILTSKTTPKYRKHSYLFSGMLRCHECKGSITWEIHKDIIYGHCNHYRNCSQKAWSKEDEIKKQLLKILDMLKIKNIRAMDWIRKALKEHHKNQIEYFTSSTNELQEKQRQLDKRLDGLYIDKLDGRITQPYYDKKSEEFSEELDKIKEKISKQGSDKSIYHQLGINFYDLAQKGSKVFDKAKVQKQQLLLKLVFKELNHDEGKLYFKFNKAFEVLCDIAKEANSSKTTNITETKNEIFELGERIDLKGQMASFFAARPVLLTDKVSNLQSPHAASSDIL